MEKRKKIDNLLHFDLSGLDICDHLYGYSWACWIKNLRNCNFCDVLHIYECLGNPFLQSLCTSAIRRKPDQDEGNIHITQDVVRVVRVLPSHSCALSFAIQATVFARSDAGLDQLPLSNRSRTSRCAERNSGHSRIVATRVACTHVDKPHGVWLARLMHVNSIQFNSSR